MWKQPDGSVVFRTRVKERDKVVLANGAAALYAEVPVKASKAAAKALEAPKAAEAPKPAEGSPPAPLVFAAIGALPHEEPRRGRQAWATVYLSSS
jgi:hypothetical protein